MLGGYGYIVKRKRCPCIFSDFSVPSLRIHLLLYFERQEKILDDIPQISSENQWAGKNTTEGGCPGVQHRSAATGCAGATCLLSVDVATRLVWEASESEVFLVHCPSGRVAGRWDLKLYLVIRPRDYVSIFFFFRSIVQCLFDDVSSWR